MNPPRVPLRFWLAAADTPLIGRRTERETLNECWDQVVESKRQIVLLGGDPGIGKSRLVAELLRKMRSNSAEQGKRHPYGGFVGRLWGERRETA